MARLMVLLTTLVMLVCVLAAAGCVCAPADPLGGKITVVGGTGKGEEPMQSTPTQATQTPPVPPTQEMERHITITASNSIFSIGLPPGYTEERQVNARQPVNFWFEYLSSDMSLWVNGQEVAIPVRWSSQVGYTEGVTSFSYVLKNRSGQYLSYNLHMLPTKSGTEVQAVTREKWKAP